MVISTVSPTDVGTVFTVPRWAAATAATRLRPSPWPGVDRLTSSRTKRAKMLSRSSGGTLDPIEHPVDDRRDLIEFPAASGDGHAAAEVSRHDRLGRGRDAGQPALDDPADDQRAPAAEEEDQAEGGAEQDQDGAVRIVDDGAIGRDHQPAAAGDRAIEGLRLRRVAIRAKIGHAAPVSGRWHGRAKRSGKAPPARIDDDIAQIADRRLGLASADRCRQPGDAVVSADRDQRPRFEGDARIELVDHRLVGEIIGRSAKERGQDADQASRQQDEPTYRARHHVSRRS